jgi:uncharacterized SAM-binding protein YcdF (DUF218 family)
MTLFAIKKFITAFLLPPGLFVVLLLGSGIWLARRKNRIAALFAILLALSLWAVALVPVADRLMSGLEKGQTMPRPLAGDVLILLGGGLYDEVLDLSGKGAPAAESLARLVTAARAQETLQVPIIVSGGKVFAGKPAEAEVIRRFLIDLGVPAGMIIIEDQSRDTVENARFSGAICTRRGLHKPLLVTSALHMERAVRAFAKERVKVVPLPVNLLARERRHYVWAEYLPDPGALRCTSLALHEYLGLLFYRFTL